MGTFVAYCDDPIKGKASIRLSTLTGNWDNDTETGAFNRNWNNYQSNDNDNYSFRACD